MAAAMAREAARLAAEVDSGGEMEAWALTVLSRVLLATVPGGSRSHDEAVSAAERAAEIGAHLAPESMATAEALAALGRARLENGDLDGAEEPFQRALAIRAHNGPGNRWEATSRWWSCV